MDKLVASFEEALEGISDGAIIGLAGFFAVGAPRALLEALANKGTRDLTMAVGCGGLVGNSEFLDLLVKQGQIKRVIDSYPLFRSASKGAKSLFEQAIRAGDIEVQVYPLGTLAEKFRAAAAGIPAFYTPTGVGTILAEGKEIREFDGRPNVLETALKPDFAFVHAYMGDPEGNLTYRLTARNFNPVIAAAAKVTIAEVENIVELGELGPNDIHTPGIYVQRMIEVGRKKVNVAIN